jgi:hypothetical protein
VDLMWIWNGLEVGLKWIWSYLEWIWCWFQIKKNNGRFSGNFLM